MQTISVSSLKAHLSAELKKVERGERITVLDHKRPVAVLNPIAEDAFPISVKTLDALHLASALALAESSPEETILVFTHHAAMNRCAKALGFKAPLAE